MSEQKRIFSLKEVSASIQKTLRERYTSDYWVKAEMNKLNYYPHTGHCYPDLVEKQSGKIVAQMRSTLWKDDFYKVNQKFLRVLKEPLKDGVKILFLARVTYDPVYGLSLWILDIDPAFTLGDIEREKQETIQRLRDEGIYTNNQSLPFALLPQRIAIISVESSKGYADFTHIIEQNPWGYKFFHYLFPSLLQGDNASQSIINQLHRIEKVSHHFDVVAVVRGGGGDVGLSCFNDFALARQIATFPLPVITGIGHATNETVVEMISFFNAITPTKLAEFLIQRFHNFANPVEEARRKIVDRCRNVLKEEQERFGAEIKYFRSAAEKHQARSKNDIHKLSSSLNSHGRFLLSDEKQRLSSAAANIRKDSLVWLRENRIRCQQLTGELSLQSNLRLHSDSLQLDHLERNVSNMSPAQVLKRGFSITYVDGRSLRDSANVHEGMTIESKLHQGSIYSRVTSIKPPNNE